MAYQGTKAKIPLGEFGLLTDIAPDKMPPNALIGAKNICYFNGTVQKAPGSIRWNADPLPAGIVAVHDWNPNTITQRMIAVTSAGSIYKGRDRIFGSAITTGLGALTPNCSFAEGGAEVAGNPKKLFLFTNGASLPRVLAGDGSTFTAIASPDSDWAGTNFPKFGVIHRNRLWAFAGQFSYASDTGDHENFATNGLTESIYPGEGGELRGAFVFKGRLFAFKDGGFVYWLNDSSADDAEWHWLKASSNFGLSAPNAICEVLDNFFAGNTTGTITDYGATERLGNIEASDLIQLAQFESYLRATTSKVGVTEQHMIYYSEKKLMLATYRSAYYNYNDMLLAFDFSRSEQVRPSYWIKGSPQCLGLYKDINQILRPMYGDKDGYVYLMDREDRLEGTASYEGSFQIPHLDFSHIDPSLSQTEKHFDSLAVHYIPESAGSLSCDYYIDGRFIETITFPMVQYLRPELDTLTLNTDRLNQANTETAVRKLAGSGRTFSARFYNSGSNQSFQIPAITVMFRGGGDKAQQV